MHEAGVGSVAQHVGSCKKTFEPDRLTVSPALELIAAQHVGGVAQPS